MDDAPPQTFKTLAKDQFPAILSIVTEEPSPPAIQTVYPLLNAQLPFLLTKSNFEFLPFAKIDSACWPTVTLPLSFVKAVLCPSTFPPMKYQSIHQSPFLTMEAVPFARVVLSVWKRSGPWITKSPELKRMLSAMRVVVAFAKEFVRCVSESTEKLMW